MIQVLVYDPITYVPWSYEPERRRLAEHGVQLVLPRTPDDLPDLLPQADLLIVCEHLESAHLSLLDHCVGILCYSVGMNSVDTDEAARLGIPVSNVPGFCTEEVATHAVTMFLALQHALLPLARAAAAGQWDLPAIPELNEVRRVSAVTVGVVGLGRIGGVVARLVGAFGCRVLGTDPFLPPDAVPEGVERVPWEELLAGSDAVILCSSLTAGSHHLVDGRALGLMRPGSVLVNVARGSLVDEAALAEALRTGPLRGAALDVREFEPPGLNDPLTGTDNVILTPHVAGLSKEAVDDLHQQAADRVLEQLVVAGRLVAGGVAPRL